MLAYLQHVQAAQLPTSAIRDTIASVASQPAYQRAVAQSFWNRLVAWTIEHIVALFRFTDASGLGKVVTLALLGIVVLLVVARFIIGINAERNARSAQRDARPTRRSVALLSDAERLAAQGDFTAAAHALFAAMIAACAARGDVRVHPSKTTGDYARELRRRQADVLSPFQQFRARYDRVIYRDASCSADDYAMLSHEAQLVVAPRERAA